MAEDDLIGDVVGGSSFEDQVAKFMRTPQFTALLSSATGVSSFSTLTAGVASAGLPVGSVTAFSGIELPGGYLWCDGSTFEQVTYPELSRVLGQRYNQPGDAGTIYRVPDLRSRIPVGAGQGTGLTARTIAQQGGIENAIVPTHTHRVAGSTGGMDANNPHNHTADDHAIYQSYSGAFGGPQPGMVYAGMSATRWITGFVNGHNIHGKDINHGHPFDVTSDPSGGSGVDKNMQPYIVLHYIIKAR